MYCSRYWHTHLARPIAGLVSLSGWLRHSLLVCTLHVTGKIGSYTPLCTEYGVRPLISNKSKVHNICERRSPGFLLYSLAVRHRSPAKRSLAVPFEKKARPPAAFDYSGPRRR